MKVGIPAGIQGILFSLSNVVIQSSLNSFDDAVLVAGSSAGSNIESFVYVTMNAFYQAAITFVGQNYGAAKCDRVDKVARQCVGFAVLFGLVVGNLAYFFGAPLVGIYAPWRTRGGPSGPDPHVDHLLSLLLSAALWTPWWASCGGWAAL